MTFAGLRYMLASLLFFPLLLKRDIREQIKRLSRREWGVMVLLGVVLYTVGQGGQYLGLAYLPSVTVSLILNLSALFVAVVSSITIKERLNWLQWIGVLLNLAGVVIYFNPINNPLSGHWLGWFFAILCLVGNSVGSIIGRDVNRSANIHPIVITGISMTIGSALMLVTGILWQGLPPLSAQSIWIIVILAVVNTAVCFTLWNYTQQTLQATETAIMNNTMLVYISILAWIFLGEKQTPLGIVGLILALAGAMLVQVQLKKQPKLT
jgi:drug/metabolite transporter (DMT)-like permease